LVAQPAAKQIEQPTTKKLNFLNIIMSPNLVKFVVANFIYIYYKTPLFHMVKKTMNKEKFCDICSKKTNCSVIYQKLGGSKGPSVAAKVIIAFGLPIVVFIIFLAIFEKALAEKIISANLKTALIFLFALTGTLIYILLAKVVISRSNKSEKGVSIQRQ
jgi:hypothetical protein